MAPPWGIGWRKCGCRGYPRGFLAASSPPPPQFRQCFQRHPKTEPKKHRFFDAFFDKFSLQLASIWANFWDDFRLHFLDLFSMCFLLILAPFVLTPTFNFSALAYMPCAFSSFRQVAKSTKTTPTHLQNYLQIQPEINQQIHQQINQKLYLVLDRFLAPKWSQHDLKMGGNKIGKI